MLENKMIKQKYYEEFVDKQSFEEFIKDFNDRLNKLVTTQNNLINKLIVFEENEIKLERRAGSLSMDLDRLTHTALKNFEKLNTAFVTLKLEIELIDKLIQTFLREYKGTFTNEDIKKIQKDFSEG